MFKTPRARIIGGILAALTGLSVLPRSALSYPVDCAILLCLAGGWPSSAECVHAKTVFIRRITPYPVEPPLQIWRCPMGVGHSGGEATPLVRLYDVAEQATVRLLPQASSPLSEIYEGAKVEAANDEQERAEVIRRTLARVADSIKTVHPATLGIGTSARLSQANGSADIDISDPAFNFVRSIRVFQIVASRGMQGSDGGNCVEHDNTALGTYGPQGSFSWRDSTMNEAPTAFRRPGPENDCSTYRVRAMFVDWRDYEGNYGYERVDY